jgi:hypothetical protein
MTKYVNIRFGGGFGGAPFMVLNLHTVINNFGFNGV